MSVFLALSFKVYLLHVTEYFVDAFHILAVVVFVILDR